MTEEETSHCISGYRSGTVLTCHYQNSCTWACHFVKLILPTFRSCGLATNFDRTRNCIWQRQYPERLASRQTRKAPIGDKSMGKYTDHRSSKSIHPKECKTYNINQSPNRTDHPRDQSANLLIVLLSLSPTILTTPSSVNPLTTSANSE
jgi:hypothetical protein